jgi:hypothetical protein
MSGACLNAGTSTTPSASRRGSARTSAARYARRRLTPRRCSVGRRVSARERVCNDKRLDIFLIIQRDGLASAMSFTTRLEFARDRVVGP